MKHIPNRDLFPTPKDAEIAHLKYIIAKFKEYDKKRTADYHRVYKELEWYKQEYNDLVGSDNKAEKIKNQGEMIARLQTVISMNKYKDDYSLADIDKYRQLQELTHLKLQLSRKCAEAKSLKEEVSKLVTELNSKKK